MNYVVMICVVALWLYVLHVMTRAELHAWRFLWGSMGLFVILMIWVQPIFTQPLARSVAAMAGIVGNLTGTFTAYFKYGIIFVATGTGSVTMQIDFECSGIIEIMAFLCLLIFFKVYTNVEKVLIGMVGFAYIMFCNAFRIVLICLSVYWFGMPAYYISHTIIGRIVFYFLSVLLYFYVFTKPQIFQMKVGNFSYGDNK